MQRTLWLTFQPKGVERVIDVPRCVIQNGPLEHAQGFHWDAVQGGVRLLQQPDGLQDTLCLTTALRVRQDLTGSPWSSNIIWNVFSLSTNISPAEEHAT